MASSLSSRGAAAVDHPRSEHDRARERVLSGVAWSTTAAFGIATPWLLIEGLPALSQVVFVSCSCLVLCAALARRRPLWLRLGVLVLALYAAATDAIALRGYTPNAFFALGLLVVVTTLVRGRGFGLFSVAVVAATIFGVSLLHRQGVILREPIGSRARP